MNMIMDFREIVKGLHHVTATVNDAQEDYHFYTSVLGLRLVKETVNFDNEQVYHFYYANETGLPSTVFTTFPYKGQRVRQGVVGYGQVVETAFSVPAGALPFWRERLEQQRIGTEETNRFGRSFLLFQDPSGLRLSLLEDDTDNREPVWTTDGIEQAQAIRGIHHVTLAVDEPEVTVRFIEAFGYRKARSDRGMALMEATGDKLSLHTQAGNALVIRSAEGYPRGVNGLGTVHHVAHRVPKLEHLLHIREWLESEMGLRVTYVRDRKYFKSIYFRIPGGVLFEVATVDPGFLVDETPEELGSSLRLPDWQEPRRQHIVENLKPYR